MAQKSFLFNLKNTITSTIKSMIVFLFFIVFPCFGMKYTHHNTFDLCNSCQEKSQIFYAMEEDTKFCSRCTLEFLSFYFHLYNMNEIKFYMTDIICHHVRIENTYRYKKQPEIEWNSVASIVSYQIDELTLILKIKKSTNLFLIVEKILDEVYKLKRSRFWLEPRKCFKCMKQRHYLIKSLCCKRLLCFGCTMSVGKVQCGLCSKPKYNSKEECQQLLWSSCIAARLILDREVLQIPFVTMPEIQSTVFKEIKYDEKFLLAAFSLLMGKRDGKKKNNIKLSSLTDPENEVFDSMLQTFPKFIPKRWIDPIILVNIGVVQFNMLSRTVTKTMIQNLICVIGNIIFASFDFREKFNTIDTKQNYNERKKTIKKMGIFLERYILIWLNYFLIYFLDTDLIYNYFVIGLIFIFIFIFVNGRISRICSRFLQNYFMNYLHKKEKYNFY